MMTTFLPQAPAADSARRPDCVVATWFFPEQPGYLDFAYRLRAIATAYPGAIVLSRARLDAPELAIDALGYQVLEARGQGNRALAHYWVAVRRFVRERRPRLLVLLGSQLAPVAIGLPIPTVLYWNEHPSHLFPAGGVAAAMLRGLAYRGARSASRVLPIGEAHRDDLLERGADPARTRLMYMGVHRDFAPPRPPEARPHAPLRLIYTGSVAPERGRDVMLEGLARALATGARAELMLVGATPEQRSATEARIAALGIGGQASVHGRIEGHLIPGLLHEADVGLCFWEDRIYWRFNPPTKLFEYLTAGLAVIASDIRTHTRYIADGANGLIARYDPVALGDAIEAIYRSPQRLAVLRSAALASAAPYRWDRIEPEFLAVLESVATDPAAAMGNADG